MPAAVVAAVFAGLNLALVTLIFVRRGTVMRQTRHHDSLVAELRPEAVALIDADEPVEPRALGEREIGEFTELLAAYARRLRGSDRERVVEYFERSGQLDHQLRRLASRSAQTRAAAAFMIGDVGSVRAVPALLGCLDDRSRDVRAAASRSLGRLSAADAIEPLITAGVERRVPADVICLALLDIGPPAVAPIAALTSHENPLVRAAAVELIGLLGGASDDDVLLDHLADPAASVRTATATALGRLGAGDARDALVVALGDRVPAVRTASARALGQIGGRTAVSALVPLAQQDAFEPARAAAESLAAIDPALVVRLASEPGAGIHLCEAADRVAL